MLSAVEKHNYITLNESNENESNNGNFPSNNQEISYFYYKLQFQRRLSYKLQFQRRHVELYKIYTKVFLLMILENFLDQDWLDTKANREYLQSL